MPDPAPSAYRPIVEETSGAAALLRHVVPLALIACTVVAFLFPATWRRLVPGPLGDPEAGRMLSFGTLFVVATIAGIRGSMRLRENRRAAIAAFASSVGGRVTERPQGAALRAGSREWADATQVEYQAQGLPVVLTLFRGERATFSSRLTAEMMLRRDLQLQLVPGGKAMRFMMSKTFLVPVLSVAIRTSSTRGSGIRRDDPFHATDGEETPELTPDQLADRLRYLTDDPVTTGDAAFDQAWLVKASDRDLGREIVTDAGLRSALASLTGSARNLQIGIECDGPGRTGRLTVGVKAPESPELFLAMDACLKAAATALGRAGVLGGGARGVA